jgi:hypothetical protein
MQAELKEYAKNVKEIRNAIENDTEYGNIAVDYKFMGEWSKKQVTTLMEENKLKKASMYKWDLSQLMIWCFMMCYDYAFVPPLELWMLANAHEYGQFTKIYTTSSDKDLTMKILNERVPTSMVGTDYFRNPDLMRYLFRNTQSYYARQPEGKLAEHPAVFCRTPVAWDGEMLAKNVAIFNIPGYAFDNETQADYKYFDGKKEELIIGMMKKFLLIAAAAKTEQLSTVALCAFGCTNFAILFTGNFFMEIYCIALERVYDQYAYRMFGLDFVPFGMSTNEANEIRKICCTRRTENFGYFPRDHTLLDDDQVMLVNAWDPHSIAGNGNSDDPSLDGFIGRATAIGCLCAPQLWKSQAPINEIPL